MKNHSPWLDLPAIAVLVFFGCMVWPGGIFAMPSSAWTLEEFFRLVFSIAFFAGALQLTLLPYAVAATSHRVASQSTSGSSRSHSRPA
jgi:hypothetical protein